MNTDLFSNTPCLICHLFFFFLIIGKDVPFEYYIQQLSLTPEFTFFPSHTSSETKMLG